MYLRQGRSIFFLTLVAFSSCSEDRQSEVRGNQSDPLLDNPWKAEFEKLKDAPPLSWVEEAVRFHNVLRKLHGAPDLELDFELAHEAQLWALELANKSIAAGKVILEAGVENNNLKRGENSGAKKGKTKAELLNLPGSFPVRVWYSEIVNHDWKTNLWQWNSGHFTQVVWGATEKVGCGRAVTEKKCGKKGVERPPFYFVICRYTPPGNWVHKKSYQDHVKVPLEGNPNDLPDFSKFCPEESEPCPKPMTCCPKNTTLLLKEESSCKIPKGRSFKKTKTKKPTDKPMTTTQAFPDFPKFPGSGIQEKTLLKEIMRDIKKYEKDAKKKKTLVKNLRSGSKNVVWEHNGDDQKKAKATKKPKSSSKPTKKGKRQIVVVQHPGPPRGKAIKY